MERFEFVPESPLSQYEDDKADDEWGGGGNASLKNSVFCVEESPAGDASLKPSMATNMKLNDDEVASEPHNEDAGSSLKRMRTSEESWIRSKRISHSESSVIFHEDSHGAANPKILSDRASLNSSECIRNSPVANDTTKSSLPTDHIKADLTNFSSQSFIDSFFSLTPQLLRADPETKPGILCMRYP